MNSRPFRYSLLFALALTEILPVALLGTALPVMMRRAGASMEELGVLFLVMFPWSIKALWAPIIDRIGVRSSVRRYRGWLLVTHPLLLVLLVLGSFWDLPALMVHDRSAVLPALLLLTSICAFADAASHGLAVNLLRPDERGHGNGLQTAGLMAGQLVGGGVMLILVDVIGWQDALKLLSVLLLVPLPALMLYRDRLEAPARTVRFVEMLQFFRLPRIGRWVLLVATIPIGVSLALPALEVLLVDRGVPLMEVGIVMGVVASLAGIAGGLFGGTVVRHLGRQRAFYALFALCAMCMATLLLSGLADDRALLYFVIIVPTFGIMARATVLQALMMDRCRPHLASTDFTVQATVQNVSRFLFMSAGAFLAGSYGTTLVFVLGIVLTLAVMALAARILVPADFQPTDGAPN